MTHWLDFSGAPPLLIPKRLAQYWNGAIEPIGGKFLDLCTTTPRTDYDRACKAAWPGRGSLDVADGSALALYTEFDAHGWIESLGVVACGGWIPSTSQMDQATWTDPLLWMATDREFLLMNSAASGTVDVRADDAVPLSLKPGMYRIEYARIEGEYVGCFHRFTSLQHASSAA
jgi:hypothetical protein